LATRWIIRSTFQFAAVGRNANMLCDSEDHQF